jgi:hypothetical protein
MKPEIAATANRRVRERLILTLSIAVFVLICCVSFVDVSKLFQTYHIAYDSAGMLQAVIAVVVFSPVFLLFVFTEFSFGYFAGFYLSSMVAGYLWLSFFSDLAYDHQAARASAAASAITFLLPALFLYSPISRTSTLSAKTFDRVLVFIFLISAATVLLASTYSFRIVSPGEASNLRSNSIPTILNYLIGVTSSSLLPFLFACLVARKAFWRSGAVLALMLFYYPIAMSKTAFFAPVWLVLLSVLSRFVGSRMTVVLSLLLPTLAGVVLLLLFNNDGSLSRFASAYFFNVNFRMIAVPSLAIDLYNEFFSRHELTYFCQIGILKRIVGCPYSEQLGVVMLHYFPGGGTYNASLFATEGVASVGLLLAPVSAFVCGLVIALGNRASSGLPPPFILVSSAILVQALLNVPLSTVLVTHGAALLFLLWYVTPREMFERDDRTRICA